jgi:hypothetical protein
MAQQQHEKRMKKLEIALRGSFCYNSVIFTRETELLQHKIH